MVLFILTDVTTIIKIMFSYILKLVQEKKNIQTETY